MRATQPSPLSCPRPLAPAATAPPQTYDGGTGTGVPSSSLYPEENFTSVTVTPSLSLVTFTLPTPWKLAANTPYMIMTQNNNNYGYYYTFGTGSGAGTPVMAADWANLNLHYQSELVIPPLPLRARSPAVHCGGRRARRGRAASSLVQQLVASPRAPGLHLRRSMPCRSRPPCCMPCPAAQTVLGMPCRALC